MAALLTDWQFLVFVGGLILVLGEGRLKIAQLWKTHIAENDPEKMRLKGERDALISHSLRQLAENVADLKQTQLRLDGKQSDGGKRIWHDIEQIKVDIARLYEVSSRLDNHDVDRRKKRAFQEDE